MADTQQQSIHKLVKQIQQSLANSSVGAAARAKVEKWLKITEQELRDTMRFEGYMPRTPINYSRTGGYGQATYRSSVRQIGSAMVGEVSYAPYSLPSWFTPGASVDVPTLFEHGYTTWFEGPPYFGSRKGHHIMEMTANQVIAAAAADGVTITFNP